MREKLKAAFTKFKTWAAENPYMLGGIVCGVVVLGYFLLRGKTTRSATGDALNFIPGSGGSSGGGSSGSGTIPDLPLTGDNVNLGDSGNILDETISPTPAPFIPDTVMTPEQALADIGISPATVTMSKNIFPDMTNLSVIKLPDIKDDVETVLNGGFVVTDNQKLVDELSETPNSSKNMGGSWVMDFSKSNETPYMERTGKEISKINNNGDLTLHDPGVMESLAAAGFVNPVSTKGSKTASTPSIRGFWGEIPTKKSNNNRKSSIDNKSNNSNKYSNSNKPRNNNNGRVANYNIDRATGKKVDWSKVRL